jgi:hypothetical protein
VEGKKNYHPKLFRPIVHWSFEFEQNTPVYQCLVSAIAGQSMISLKADTTLTCLPFRLVALSATFKSEDAAGPNRPWPRSWIHERLSLGFSLKKESMYDARGDSWSNMIRISPVNGVKTLKS